MELGVPPDFGGLVAYWRPDGRALVLRFGHGEVQDGMRLTPLNALQLRKTLDDLIADGRARGHITGKHDRQSEQLPTVAGLESVLARRTVDEIAGDG